jgi:hypothetical protein
MHGARLAALRQLQQMLRILFRQRFGMLCRKQHESVLRSPPGTCYEVV